MSKTSRPIEHISFNHRSRISAGVHLCTMEIIIISFLWPLYYEILILGMYFSPRKDETFEAFHSKQYPFLTSVTFDPIRGTNLLRRLPGNIGKAAFAGLRVSINKQVRICTPAPVDYRLPSIRFSSPHRQVRHPGRTKSAYPK